MGKFDNVFAYSLAGGAATGTGTGTAVTPQWDAATKGTNVILTNNNLTVTTNGSGGDSIKSNVSISSGKKYWEITLTGSHANGSQALGICTASLSSNQYPGATATSYGFYSYNGNKYTNGAGTNYSSVSNINNDVIGIAFDADNGTLEFFKNGVSMGIAFTNIPTNTYFAAIGHGSSGTVVNSTTAFSNFVFPLPSGFSAF